MGLKKIQLVAQIVGFVTIGLLSISGVLAITSDGSPAWAALGQASPSMSARVPNVINYQGMLRRPDGSVINGTYTMTFRLYDSPEGGNVVHTEQLSNVVVRDGLFTVLLGDGDGNPIQAADFKDPLYVGIQVENDAEMQPRQRIAPVPYAVQLTDGVYVGESGNVGIGTTGPIAKLDVMQVKRTSTHPDAVNGLYVTGNFDQDRDGVEFRHTNGTQGIGFGYNTIYATGTNADQDLNLMPRGTGGVGIGTTSPAATLDVQGSINVRGNPLVMIKRFYQVPDGSWNTEIPAYGWWCVVGGWYAKVDINEIRSHGNGFWTYRGGADPNKTWWVFSNLQNHNYSGSKRHVDVVCFRAEITVIEGWGFNAPPDWY